MPGADPAVFLLTGPSAAGKSTVGPLLAARFERGAYVEGDFFRRSIVAGRHELTPELSPAALAQLRLRYRLAAATADTYFAHGFSVVVGDVAAGPLLEDYAGLFRSRPLHLVVLLPSLPAVAAREAGREQNGYARFSIEQLHDGFARGTPRIGLWLDTSEQTPEQTVAAILAGSDRSLVAAA